MAPEIERELPELRTRTSRTYLTTDHNYRSEISAVPIYYRQGGRWLPIDNRLVLDDTPGFAKRNAANAYVLRLPPDLGSAPLRIESGSDWVSFSVIGAGALRSADSNEATYDGPAGTALTVEALAEGIRETLVLEEPTISSVAYRVEMSPGVDARVAAGGRLEFVDAHGAVLFSAPRPTVYDSNAEGAETSGSFTLAPAPGGALLTLSVDPAWLADPERVWPVVIDPDVQVGATKECHISGGSDASTSFCGSAKLHVGLNSNTWRRTLLYFDVASAVPMTAEVLMARLRLTTSDTATAAAPISVHELLQSWTTSATWNKRDGTNNWTTAGGTYDAAAADTRTVGTSAGENAYWYMLEPVQSWVDGTRPNNGLLLKQQAEDVSTYHRFKGASYADAPALIVTWQHRLGERRHYGELSFGLGARSALAVNAANGNLVLSATDLAVAGTGPALRVDRYYNSLAASQRGAFGNGWVMGGANDVRLQIWADGSVNYFGPSGYQVTFRRNADGTFSSPTAADATLVGTGGTGASLLDRATENEGNAGTLSSGAVGTLAQADELVVAAFRKNGTEPVGSHSGGLTEIYETNSSHTISIATKVTSSTADVTYTATSGASKDYAVLVATFRAAPGQTISELSSQRTNYEDLTSPTAVTVTYPVAPASGDLLVAHVAVNQNGSVSATPPGWMLAVESDAAGAYSHRGGTYYKLAGASEPTTHTWALTGSSSWAHGFASEWSGIAGGDPLGHELRFKAGGKLVFADGRLTSIVDRNANAVEMTYTADDQQIERITDAQGRVATFTSSGCCAYLVTAASDPAARSFGYAYNANSDLTGYTDPAGGATTYTYDASSRLTEVTDPGGRRTRIAYDGSGRVASVARVSDPGTGSGPTWTFSYQTGRTVATDPAGHATSYLVDALGRVTEVIDPAGSSVEATYTANSDPLTLTDALSATSTNDYDALDNLTLSQLPTGASAAWQYADAAHPYFPTRQTDSRGRNVTYAYDAAGNVSSVTNELPNQNTASFAYNADGTLATRTDAKGNVTAYSYDAAGNLTGIDRPAPLGDVSLEYDTLSRLVRQTDGKGQVTTYQYDTLDRVTRITFDDGSTIERAHDASGNLTSLTDATGTTTYTYDALGQLTTETLPGGRTTSYAYDAAGRLASLTDARGTVGYEYDDADRVVGVTQGDPETIAELSSQRTSYEDLTSPTAVVLSYPAAPAAGDLLVAHLAVDGGGSVAAAPAGWSVAVESDAAGAYNHRGGIYCRIAGPAEPSTYTWTLTGSPSWAYGFASEWSGIAVAPLDRSSANEGNATTLSSGAVGTLAQPDELVFAVFRKNQTEPVHSYSGGLTEIFETNSQHTIAVATKVTSSAADVTYTATTSTARSYAVLVATFKAGRHGTAFSYDANGQRTRTTYPNGVTMDQTYDASGRLTRITSKAAADAVVADFTYTYTYPATGNDTALRQSVTDKDGQRTTYGYDGAGRLVSAETKDAGGAVVHRYDYAYDGNSNRTSQTVDGVSTTYSYNAADELTQAGSVTYSYDANGNETGNSAGRAISYNAQDQTVSLTPAGGSSIPMGYTGGGQYRRVAAGGTTYTGNAMGLASETTAGATTYYTWAGAVINSSGSAGTFYPLFDGLGSVVALTDETGAIVATYAYDPFGGLISSTGSVANPWRFIGGARVYFDAATGLYKNGRPLLRPGPRALPPARPHPRRRGQPLRLRLPEPGELRRPNGRVRLVRAPGGSRGSGRRGADVGSGVGTAGSNARGRSGRPRSPARGARGPARGASRRT